MKLLDRYILFKYLSTFVYAITLLLMIVVVFDVAEKFDDFLESEATAWMIIKFYYFNFIPYFAVLFCPLFAFIANIYFTSRMAYQTEFVAVLATGTNFYRLLLPYMIGATIIGAADYWAINWWVPHATEEMHEFSREYLHSNYHNIDRDIHLQITENSYVYVQHYRTKDSTALKFSLETFNGDRLVQKITSQKASWNNEKEAWDIHYYTTRINTGLEEEIRSGKLMDTVINLHPKDFGRKVSSIQAMDTRRLKDFIADEESKGVSELAYYYIELHKRTAVPFSTYILTLIGFALASRKTRGGTGLHLLAGITLGFSYIVFMQFSTTFSTNADLPPLISVWIPNLIYLGIGFILLRYAQK